MNYEKIRELISHHNGTFVGVEFIKADGSVRRMAIQQDSARTNAKGAGASEAAQRATQSRARNNPNLLNVWEVGKGYRSVNLDTLRRVSMRGRVYHFAPAQGGAQLGFITTSEED